MKIARREFLERFGAALTAASLGAAATASGAARAPQIKVGVCTHPSDFAKVVQYGFDYIEPAAAEVAAMDDSAFQSFKRQVLASPIRCECFNSLVRSLRVVGDDVNADALRNYLEPALARCRELGATVVVWGSSGSRNVPPGFSRDRAWQQIVDFLRLANDVARAHGIIVAIEPLRTQESNIINTGAEAQKLVHEVNRPNIRMIIDYYHLSVMKEDPEIIWRARKDIVHFHFANPAGRLWPKSPSEDPEYAQFFAMVKKIHFRGGISIEGNGNIDADAAQSLAFFRSELA